MAVAGEVQELRKALAELAWLLYGQKDQLLDPNGQLLDQEGVMLPKLRPVAV